MNKAAELEKRAHRIWLNAGYAASVSKFIHISVEDLYHIPESPAPRITVTYKYGSIVINKLDVLPVFFRDRGVHIIWQIPDQYTFVKYKDQQLQNKPEFQVINKYAANIDSLEVCYVESFVKCVLEDFLECIKNIKFRSIKFMMEFDEETLQIIYDATRADIYSLVRDEIILFHPEF
jgi:hypothetical protein